MLQKSLTIIIAAMAIFLFSCEKDARVKPAITLKQDAGYVYKDTTLAVSTAFKIGVSVKKTEDALKSYTATVTINGTKNTIENTSFGLFASERSGFDKSHDRTTSSSAATELYEVTVSDQDGNISTTKFTVTVK